MFLLAFNFSCWAEFWGSIIIITGSPKVSHQHMRTNIYIALWKIPSIMHFLCYVSGFACVACACGLVRGLSVWPFNSTSARPTFTACQQCHGCLNWIHHFRPAVLYSKHTIKRDILLLMCRLVSSEEPPTLIVFLHIALCCYVMV